jgi:putative FmdB family regulatory protein
VPLYEYRCRTCETTFEARRPMAESSEPTTCPEGHPGAVRLLSVFASVGSSGAPSGAGAPSQMPMGGGCGAACGCH